MARIRIERLDVDHFINPADAKDSDLWETIYDEDGETNAIRWLIEGINKEQIDGDFYHYRYSVWHTL